MIDAGASPAAISLVLRGPTAAIVARESGVPELTLSLRCPAVPLRTTMGSGVGVGATYPPVCPCPAPARSAIPPKNGDAEGAKRQSRTSPVKASRSYFLREVPRFLPFLASLDLTDTAEEASSSFSTSAPEANRANQSST